MIGHCRYRPSPQQNKLRLAALLLAVSLFCALDCHAQGEHARRVGAELAVLAADVHKLTNATKAPDPGNTIAEPYIGGLRQRIEGGLVSLDILTRLADQEQGRQAISRYRQLHQLREKFRSDLLSAVSAMLDDLKKEYPLLLPDIIVPATAEFIELHNTLCAACHDHPDQTVSRPAYNLATQTRETSAIDMFARMLVGVRGDRITGIDNPLSDRQIIGLLSYYRDLPERTEQP